MPSIEVTEDDLEKANQQIALLEELVVDYQGRGGDNSAVIGKLEADIREIRAEAKRYDYKLNPRPRAEICTLCNLHPMVTMPSRPCPSCGCIIVNAQPPSGKVHWKVPGETQGKAMAPGEEPA